MRPVCLLLLVFEANEYYRIGTSTAIRPFMGESAGETARDFSDLGQPGIQWQYPGHLPVMVAGIAIAGHQLPHHRG